MQVSFVDAMRFANWLHHRGGSGETETGAGMDNASSHDSTNLPILIAGGRFKHGQHVAHDPKNPHPLSTFGCKCCSRWAWKSANSAPQRGIPQRPQRVIFTP